MNASSIVAGVAGAASVRRGVNAGFRAYGRRRAADLARLDPIAVQERTLLSLVRRARSTRFGKDHGFESIGSVARYQERVPPRTYEDLWRLYLKDSYPVYEDLTWPGRIPFLALTSGTTTGATKFIPVSWEMVASNRKSAQTMVGAYMASRPRSRLFQGRLFFLGGSSDLETVGPGVRQGDLSAIAAKTVGPMLRPYTFPALDVALEGDWDRKLALMAEQSLAQPITLVSGVSSCLLTLFQRVLALSGKTTVSEVWPTLEIVVHGGVKFDPYCMAFEKILGSSDIQLQESYPCSEGFIAFGDPSTGLLRLLLDHEIFYEFIPVDELDADRPKRHWMGTAQAGVNYAIVVSTCAGMWAHVIGDTIRFESLSPPLLTFTGRTKYTLSAFGEHLISEEIEGAVAAAAEATGALVREWHVGPVFRDPLGYHQFVIEFLEAPSDLSRFRRVLDGELIERNAHYQWFRAEGGGLPSPALVVTAADAFDDWMRSRGQLGGQHKVPRVDSSGRLTAELRRFLEENKRALVELPPGNGAE
jgi:hypothetical protein